MRRDTQKAGGAQKPRPGRLWAIMRKDITLFARDRLFIFLTVLSVAAFVTLYWVLPREVNETVTVGIRGEGMRTLLEADGFGEGAAGAAGMPEEEDEAAGAPAESAEPGEGIAVSWYDTTDDLRQAVADREVEVGIDFPVEFVSKAAAGEKVSVTLFVRPGLPDEVRKAMGSLVREIAFSLAGYELQITEPEEEAVVLGEDMAGKQIPLREQLKPLYAFMVLIMEAVALGALIASEIQQRTITAVLATSTRLIHVLGAKLLLGSGIAFSEGVLIMLLIRGFGVSPGAVILSLLLGAFMVTGIAMIAGSAGKDLVSTMLISLLFLIPLAVPAFALLFPGSPGWWMEIIPSYGLVKAVSLSTVAGEGGREVVRYLGALAGWTAVIVFTGMLVLKRRAESL